MAIDFSDRILITNPTAYHLGRGVILVAAADVATGALTHYFAQEVLLPPLGWCIMAGPTAVIGAILVACGLTKV